VRTTPRPPRSPRLRTPAATRGPRRPTSRSSPSGRTRSRRPRPPAAIAADLDAAKAQAESYLDDLRRLQADFDNYRKRTLREQTARAASASQALVARLLPVLDNFELAVSHAEQSRDFDGMLKGVEMVFGELREVLQGEGLVKIEAEGKPFDPERHEAVVAVEQEGAEPGTVVDVVRAGYELRGRVLRPAMVKVAK
jgi:molecular chaperone GrpE